MTKVVIRENRRVLAKAVLMFLTNFNFPSGLAQKFGDSSVFWFFDPERFDGS